MITKYSSNVAPTYWYSKETSQDLVDLLVQHKAEIQTEIDEVLSGDRKLKEDDFLGPKEREHRKKQKTLQRLMTILNQGGYEEYKRALNEEAAKDYSSFFEELDKNILENRINNHRNEALGGE